MQNANKNTNRIQVLISFSLVFYSVQIVTERQWPNVHYADERHIVQHFVSEKIGIHIRLNVPGIRTRVHSKLCCWSTNKPNDAFNCE